MKYNPFHLRGKGNEFRDSEGKGLGSTLSTSTTDNPQMQTHKPEQTSTQTERLQISTTEFLS